MVLTATCSFLAMVSTGGFGPVAQGPDQFGAPSGVPGRLGADTRRTFQDGVARDGTSDFDRTGGRQSSGGALLTVPPERFSGLPRGISSEFGDDELGRATQKSPKSIYESPSVRGGDRDRGQQITLPSLADIYDGSLATRQREQGRDFDAGDASGSSLSPSQRVLGLRPGETGIDEFGRPIDTSRSGVLSSLAPGQVLQPGATGFDGRQGLGVEDGTGRADDAFGAPGVFDRSGTGQITTGQPILPFTITTFPLSEFRSKYREKSIFLEKLEDLKQRNPDVFRDIVSPDADQTGSLQPGQSSQPGTSGLGLIDIPGQNVFGDQRAGTSLPSGGSTYDPRRIDTRFPGSQGGLGVGPGQYATGRGGFSTSSLSSPGGSTPSQFDSSVTNDGLKIEFNKKDKSGFTSGFGQSPDGQGAVLQGQGLPGQLQSGIGIGGGIDQPGARDGRIGQPGIQDSPGQIGGLGSSERPFRRPIAPPAPLGTFPEQIQSGQDRRLGPLSGQQVGQGLQPTQYQPGQLSPAQYPQGQPGQLLPGQVFPGGFPEGQIPRKVKSDQSSTNQFPGQFLPGQAGTPRQFIQQPGQLPPGQIPLGQYPGQIFPGQFGSSQPGLGVSYAPGQFAPGQFIPGQGIGRPGQPALGGQYAPNQFIPGQGPAVIPGQTGLGGQFAPGHSTPGQFLPEQRSGLPGQIGIGGQLAPGQSVPGQYFPGQGPNGLPGQTGLGDQFAPGQSTPGQFLPGQTATGQFLPGQGPTGIPGQTGLGDQFGPGQSTPGIFLPGQTSLPGQRPTGFPGQVLGGGQFLPSQGVGGTPGQTASGQFIPQQGVFGGQFLPGQGPSGVPGQELGGGQTFPGSGIGTTGPFLPSQGGLGVQPPSQPGIGRPGQFLPGQPIVGSGAFQPGQRIPGQIFPGQPGQSFQGGVPYTQYPGAQSPIGLDPSVGQTAARPGQLVAPGSVIGTGPGFPSQATGISPGGVGSGFDADNGLVYLSNPMNAPVLQSISVSCDMSAHTMDVSLIFDRPFDGLVYAKGYYKNDICRLIADRQTELNFRINLDTCGMLTSTTGVTAADRQRWFENVVVIMNDKQAGILEAWDKAYKVSCGASDFGNHEMRLGITVPMISTLAAPGFEVKMPDTWMKIIRGMDPNAEPVNQLVLGEMASLVVVRTDPTAMYDINLYRCVAHDGTNMQSVELLDANGCPVHTKFVMPQKKSLIQTGELAGILPFNTFKFPDEQNVFFKCEVQLCFNKCQELNCPAIGAARVKRSVNQWKLQPEYKFLSALLEKVNSSIEKNKKSTSEPTSTPKSKDAFSTPLFQSVKVILPEHNQNSNGKPTSSQMDRIVAIEDESENLYNDAHTNSLPLHDNAPSTEIIESPLPCISFFIFTTLVSFLGSGLLGSTALCFYLFFRKSSKKIIDKMAISSVSDHCRNNPFDANSCTASANHTFRRDSTPDNRARSNMAHSVNSQDRHELYNPDY